MGSGMNTGNRSTSDPYYVVAGDGLKQGNKGWRILMGNEKERPTPRQGQIVWEKKVINSNLIVIHWTLKAGDTHRIIFSKTNQAFLPSHTHSPIDSFHILPNSVTPNMHISSHLQRHHAGYVRKTKTKIFSTFDITFATTGVPHHPRAFNFYF